MFEYEPLARDAIVECTELRLPEDLVSSCCDDRFRIAAIDRSKREIMRFELSSGYETIWLEHRIDSELDTEFTNGIEQSFTRQYYVSLSPSWYLVRDQ